MLPAVARSPVARWAATRTGSLAGLLSLLLLALPPFGGVVQAQNQEDTAGPATSGARKLVVPLANAAEGKKLFVGKGCVVCHSVNGVGGKAAPALDAAGSSDYLDVFDFAARMWRGAPTMILLQEMELGYQIEIDGEELAHLAAFASDPDAQAGFSESDIPEVIRDWMVDEVYQELDPDNMAR